jgi:hypothetical protein
MVFLNGFERSKIALVEEVFAFPRWRVNLTRMGAVKLPVEKVKTLSEVRVLTLPRKFPKGATMFMLRLIRGNLSIADIEAHLVLPIERPHLVKLYRAARNEPPFVRRKAQVVIFHFYSSRKDSTEILKMLNVLVEKYSGCKTIYLSWDHASWHSSKILLDEISKLNGYRYRKKWNTPMVKLAPLPARSQFLNVIESVFSGMAAAIIENSNYKSVAEAKTAIDRYFAERNDHFLKHPKRAGKRIWGKEQVPAEFKEGQNCKNPAWR